MDMSRRRLGTIREAEATPGQCDPQIRGRDHAFSRIRVSRCEGAMTRITSVRALGHQFRIRALTVKDPALALELHELADICEQKAASLGRRIPSDAE
jgi:hypothetical protein